MRLIGLAVIFTFSLILAPLAAEAQAGKVYRIGFLGVSSAADYAANLQAFRQGLRDLGYEEGKNISIEYRLLLNSEKCGNLDQRRRVRTSPWGGRPCG